MCGRYTIIATAKEIEQRFNVGIPAGYVPRYNAAPTQMLPVITNERREQLSFYRWGLQASWVKQNTVTPLFNSRIETIEEKSTFRDALVHRRCLVPADGYYEWKRLSKKSKIPYRISLGKNQLFSFAGIWDVVVGEGGVKQPSFSIITTSATAKLSSIHDRMPVILSKDAEKLWLEEAGNELDLTGFLIKNMITDLESYSVSSQVNSVKNDFAALIVSSQPVDQFGSYNLFS